MSYRFIYMPAPNTAEVICEALIDTLMEWNVDRKLSTLTLDNCTTNDCLIDKVKDKIDKETLILRGKLFHMRCAAHILNLIVKEGLEKFPSGVEKVRESVNYWTATPKRIERFEQAVKQLDMSYTKKLEHDCKTRWNSTYLMLKTALMYKQAFFRLKNREAQYKCFPSDEDWAIAKELCDRLQRFYNVTLLFSGSNYPTANLFFIEICELRLSLNHWITSERAEIREISHLMIEKFEKYWDVIHGILTVANVLDPRYKLKSFKCYFPLIYGEAEAAIELEKVKSTLSELIKEYQLKEKSKENKNKYGTTSSMMSDSSRSTSDSSYIFDTWIENEDVIDDLKSELDFYLEESVHPRVDNFDILDWWKIQGVKYPTLQKIAKDIFAIPMTTVASESAFSTSGRVLNPYRSRLLPTTLEALMCSQDWLWSELKGN